MDKDIEDVANKCQQCVTIRPEQPKVPVCPWPKAEYAFQRIHIDHLGPFRDKMFLIITDSYTKWIEVYISSSLASAETIECIRECLARFGICATIVSDNGRSFSSCEFRIFCYKNKIEHLTSAPYHPQSNGAAENAVKSFKMGLKKALNDPKNASSSLRTVINRYLFGYRSSVHATTKQTPFQMMFGRDMRIHFDNLKPKKTTECESLLPEGTTKPKTFVPGEAVMVRGYAKDDTKWISGQVVAAKGSCMYVCRTNKGECVRHKNQMMRIKQSDASVNPVVISNCANHADFYSSNFRAGQIPQANIQRADPGQPPRHLVGPPFIREERDEDILEEPAPLAPAKIAMRRHSERPQTEIKRLQYTHNGIKF